MAVVDAIWAALTAVGSGLALSLIIAIAVGIGSLTLLFFGSAVIALEQFARSVRPGALLVVTGLCWSVLLGVAVLQNVSPEVFAAPWPTLLGEWAEVAGGCAAAVAVAVAVTWGLLRWLAPRTRSLLSMVWLGVGFALVVGGTGQLVYALAPVAIIAALAGWLAFRRSRRRDEHRGPAEIEHMLRMLAGSLALGILPALFLSQPAGAVAAAGGGLLASYALLVLLGLIPLAATGLVAARGSVEWFIALRYLTAKRRQTFVSIITGICVVGIAAGV
jgi:hypothetical protein